MSGIGRCGGTAAKIAAAVMIAVLGVPVLALAAGGGHGGSQGGGTGGAGRAGARAHVDQPVLIERDPPTGWHGPRDGGLILRQPCAPSIQERREHGCGSLPFGD